MNHARTHSIPTARGGFSLVEVTLALAICAIGLLSVLGLFPQALTSARNAADNTISATIVQDVFSTLRSGSFANADLSSVGNFLPPGPYPLPTYSSSVSNYFDKSGLTPASSADNYYKVVLGFQPQGSPALSKVTATVVWPAQSIAPMNTNVFVTLIGRYQ